MCQGWNGGVPWKDYWRLLIQGPQADCPLSSQWQGFGDYPMPCESGTRGGKSIGRATRGSILGSPRAMFRDGNALMALGVNKVRLQHA